MGALVGRMGCALRLFTRLGWGVLGYGDICATLRRTNCQITRWSQGFRKFPFPLFIDRFRLLPLSLVQPFF